MASCSGLQQIFENPLPEKPTLMESLSWNQIKSMKSIDHSSSAPSFTEIFGELHFQEVIKPLPSSFLNHDDCNSEKKKKKNPSSPSPSTSSSSTFLKSSAGATSTDAFSSKNLESLQLCTEGLGFESFDDVEELKNEVSCRDNWDDDDDEDDGHKERIMSIMKHSSSSSSSSSSNDQNYMHDKSRFTCSRKFPPPISCIGRSGKPWICFKSYRQDGRFVLKEFRIPTQEFLHACREDGRLRLHLVQPDPEQEQEQEECKEEQEQEFVEQNGGNDAHDAHQEHRDETEELPMS